MQEKVSQDIADALRQKCLHAYPQDGIDYRIEGNKVYANPHGVGCAIISDHQCMYVGKMEKCLLRQVWHL